MPNWLVLIIFFCTAQIALAQPADSIRQREVRTGVYMIGSSISEKVLKGYTGYNLEVGAFQERKLLEQVYFSYGAGAQLRDYNDIGIVIDTTPEPIIVGDTSIISYFYDVSHREFKLSTQASIRFVYITDPNIYLILGVGPEVTFQQKVSNKFTKTRFTDENFVTIGETTDDPVLADQDDFRINSFNFRFDLGLGIELNRFNIEIVNRTNNVQGIGLRIRYTFDTLTY